MSINRQPRATDQPAPTLRFGDRLGEFVINGFAGVGATSYVYRARHETSFEPVAIKVLHPHLLDDEIKRTRFLREAQMMMGFEHPNVVRFMRILDEKENLAFVMEYIEGDTLESWLEKKNGQIEQQEVLGVFVDLLRGLNHAHAGGVVHRDLKPANILITEENGRSRAKIIDFGVARFSSLPTPPEDKKKIVGTAAYISPEEVRDPDTVCQQSDIYSIGVMLYEAVCGQRPFAHMGVRELMKAHVSESPESPMSLNPDVSPALESVIMRTLAKTPEGRYDNVPSLIDAIEWSMSSPKATMKPEPFLARTAEFHRESSSSDPASVMAFFRQALMMAMTIFVVSGAGSQTNSAHHLDRFDDGHLPFG